MSSSLIGQIIGHYRVLDQLGAGGMGVVYRAQDMKLGRQVAVKVLSTGNDATDEAIERFRREARTASSLNHPNICTIYGFDEHEGQCYLAMELLDGEPLDQRLGGRSTSAPCSTSARRSRMRWTRRTARASFTATSSPRTSSSPAAAR